MLFDTEVGKTARQFLAVNVMGKANRTLSLHQKIIIGEAKNL